MSYETIKVLHLLAVILWIGPALGGYIVLARVWARQEATAIRLAEADCESVLKLEHAAFLALVATGITLLATADFALIQTEWMRRKIAIFAAIALFECFDIWVSHVVIPRALQAAGGVDGPDWKRAAYLRTWLIRLSIPVGMGIVTILWTAVTKS